MINWESELNSVYHILEVPKFIAAGHTRQEAAQWFELSLANIDAIMEDARK